MLRRRPPRCWIASLLSVGMLLIAVSARAQTPQTDAPIPSPPGNSTTMAEYQSLSCAVGGTIGGAAVYIYYEDIAAAITGDVDPILVLPLIAAGFSTGCGMASALAPAFAWFYRHLTGPHRVEAASQ